MGPNTNYKEKSKESIASVIPTGIGLANDAQSTNIADDLDSQPREEDFRQLRRVSGPIPWSTYTIAILQFYRNHVTLWHGNCSYEVLIIQLRKHLITSV